MVAKPPVSESHHPPSFSVSVAWSEQKHCYSPPIGYDACPSQLTHRLPPPPSPNYKRKTFWWTPPNTLQVPIHTARGRKALWEYSVMSWPRPVLKPKLVSQASPQGCPHLRYVQEQAQCFRNSDKQSRQQPKLVLLLIAHWFTLTK